MGNCGNVIGFFVMILMLSCNAKSDKLEKKTEEFNQKACYGIYCSEVNLNYPVFLSEPQTAAILNNSMERKMLSFLEPFEETRGVNIQEASQTFLDAYMGFMEDFESTQEWVINLDAKVSFENEKIISIVFETYSFTGGAHPNSFRQYLNFDKQRNIEIENDSLIIDKLMLLEMAESKFREIHQVEKDVPLSETDLFFLDSNQNFFLPTAIGYEIDSLVLFYNTYEIGPYVMGTTEIKIAKQNLQGVVNLYK